MWMGIAIGRAAVGGPAGVPDAGGTVADPRLRRLGQRLVQVGQLPGPLLGQQYALVDHGYASRVIPAVLQPTKPVQYHSERRPGPGVPHDPAHAPYGIRVPLTAAAHSRLIRAVRLREEVQSVCAKRCSPFARRGQDTGDATRTTAA